MELHHKVDIKQIIDGMCYQEVGLKEGEKIIFLKLPEMTVVAQRPTRSMTKRFNKVAGLAVQYVELCKMRQTTHRRAKTMEVWNQILEVLQG